MNSKYLQNIGTTSPIFLHWYYKEYDHRKGRYDGKTTPAGFAGTPWENQENGLALLQTNTGALQLCPKGIYWQVVNGIRALSEAPRNLKLSMSRSKIVGWVRTTTSQRRGEPEPSASSYTPSADSNIDEPLSRCAECHTRARGAHRGEADGDMFTPDLKRLSSAPITQIPSLKKCGEWNQSK